MSRSVNEHLEVYSEERGEWYRCSRCHYRLCLTVQDWRQASLVRQVPPRRERIVSDLLGPYWYRQRCCPACGIVLETDLIAQRHEC